MGESPGQYTTRWRMLKAQEYLQEGDYPVRYIARQVGYKSEPTFNRAFKQHFGESPGAFRKRLNQ
ncbi:MAG TPA: hypothetical protein DCR93_09785 [Cytophagales bacterium]|nr:hypothetical protein [Cytophagales bacterium]